MLNVNAKLPAAHVLVPFADDFLNSAFSTSPAVLAPPARNDLEKATRRASTGCRPISS